MSEIECAQLHSELFRRRHNTLQSHSLFALAKHLLSLMQLSSFWIPTVCFQCKVFRHIFLAYAASHCCCCQWFLQYVVDRNADTLLPQFLGMYRITVNGVESHLTVMLCVFSPDFSIHCKYDLKARLVCISVIPRPVLYLLMVDLLLICRTTTYCKMWSLQPQSIELKDYVDICLCLLRLSTAVLSWRYFFKSPVVVSETVVIY